MSQFAAKIRTKNELLIQCLTNVKSELYQEIEIDRGTFDAEAEYNDSNLLKAAKEYVKVWNEEN